MSDTNHPNRRVEDKFKSFMGGRRKEDQVGESGYNIGDVSIGDVGEGATVVIGRNHAPSTTSPEPTQENAYDNDGQAAPEIIQEPARLRANGRELPPELQRAVKSLHEFCMVLSRLN